MATVNRKIFHREGTTTEIDAATSKHARQLFFDTTIDGLGYFDNGSVKKKLFTMDTNDRATRAYGMGANKLNFGSTDQSSIQYDSGTDIYTFATNAAGGQIRLLTAASVEAIRIDASQKVGLGISIPLQKLHVENGSILVRGSATTQITVKSTDSSKEADIVATADTATAIYSAFGSTIGGSIAGLALTNMILFEAQGASSVVYSTINSGTAPMVWAPGRAEKMRLTSTGVLTIGLGASAIKITPSGTNQTIESLTGNLFLKSAGNDFNLQDSTGISRLAFTVTSGNQVIRAITGNLILDSVVAVSDIQLDVGIGKSVIIKEDGVSGITISVDGTGSQTIKALTGNLILQAAANAIVFNDSAAAEKFRFHLTGANPGFQSPTDIFDFETNAEENDRLRITVATNQTIEALTGDLNLDAAGDVLAQGNNILQDSKSITIENPTSSEDISAFFTNRAITITEIRAVLVGSATPSVTWTIRHGTDRNAAGAEAVTGGTTTTSTTTGSDVTSFNDATIVLDSFVWLETTAKSGTVTELHVTIVFTDDAA